MNTWRSYVPILCVCILNFLSWPSNLSIYIIYETLMKHCMSLFSSMNKLNIQHKYLVAINWFDVWLWNFIIYFGHSTTYGMDHCRLCRLAFHLICRKQHCLPKIFIWYVQVWIIHYCYNIWLGYAMHIPIVQMAT